MLMYGTNLLSATDQLQAIAVKDVVDRVRQPEAVMQNKIHQLRRVRRIDAKQYAALKRTLPYFVCASFQLPFRRMDNFACTECFVLDVDHLSQKDLNLQEVRSRLQQDERVMVCYVSPGEDGLKLLFRLTRRCYDAGMFSLFYKSFVKQFSEEYGLEQVVDSRTCDVTRACFMSYDPDIYYNESAVAVSMEAYVKPDDVQNLFDMKHELEMREKSLPCIEEPEIISEPDGQALELIKQTLNIRKAHIRQDKYPVVVPSILEDIIADVKQAIEQTGLIVETILNIQYGKKLKVKLGIRWGEINLFYGKRGFTVVQSPKRGSSPELNQIAADLVNCYLAGC